MAYEHKENSGTIFKNDKKLTESHPNAKGEANIGGVMYWVSAWTKRDKNGNPWQSLSFTRKEEKHEEQKKAHDPRDLSDMKSDIPW